MHQITSISGPRMFRRFSCRRRHRSGRVGDQSACEQQARRRVVPRERIHELRHQRWILHRSRRKTHQGWAAITETNRWRPQNDGSATTGLRRVHWSKEASSLGFAFPYWITQAIIIICHWIIDTMVEAIIGRWCCHVGRNNFTSSW